MDGDRKYRQRGYQDSDRRPDGSRSERGPRPGPKVPIDITGPKLPRLVETVVASRCFNCTATLPRDIDFRGTCPKCGAALHCCKQCVKPIPARIPMKDQANTCELFQPRVTVARDASPSGAIPKPGENGLIPAPRNPTDARAAFDNLFKK